MTLHLQTTTNLLVDRHMSRTISLHDIFQIPPSKTTHLPLKCTCLCVTTNTSTTCQCAAAAPPRGHASQEPGGAFLFFCADELFSSGTDHGSCPALGCASTTTRALIHSFQHLQYWFISSAIRSGIRSDTGSCLPWFRPLLSSTHASRRQRNSCNYLPMPSLQCRPCSVCKASEDCRVHASATRSDLDSTAVSFAPAARQEL